ncbi:hypothetical protein Nepgr_008512 [Nepenthes gracilis]|uniref:Plastid lipid-associated protein/fibrillin conserved domain-containing protein n=1 Tax=Nepenthes gracilis TaxID=150966 RepID=A0AAD3XJB0_NEPGR|nr:hypothetical protein Nepgr_008512 [Nepenthes gracilis]
MATKLVQLPLIAYHVCLSVPRIPNSLRTQRRVPSANPWSKYTRFKHHPFVCGPICTIKVENQGMGLLEEDEDTIPRTKAKLYQAVEGINRGVFGVSSAKTAEIKGLVEQLEFQNPTENPAFNLEKVNGCWKVIYSTITILGSKRTKLGLRDFITLGDFFQQISVDEGKAVNVIEFSALGLNLMKGQLTIEATFDIASASRVNINYSSSSITPEQLMNVFRKNYELLLSIFNPDGWLEITYVDDTMRIGRDDKGNIFILERSADIFVN